MATVIHPGKNRSISSHRTYGAVPPAEVWDLNGRDLEPLQSSAVRTLGSEYRTGGRLNAIPEVAEKSADSNFETKRENRESFLLGLLLASAVLIGCVLGGGADNEMPEATQPVAPSSQFVAK